MHTAKSAGQVTASFTVMTYMHELVQLVSGSV